MRFELQKKTKGTFSRHDNANDIIKRALESAGYPSVTEPRNLSEGDSKRPDGRTLSLWAKGKPLIWDYTCRDTVCSSYSLKTSKEAGYAADVAEKEKADKYQEFTHDFNFTPVANETLGSWGKSSIKFIQDVGSRIAERTGEKRSTSYLFQRLGINTQRGNAASILGTLPTGKELEELYYI